MTPSITRRGLLMSGAAALVLARASRADAANPPLNLTAGRRTLDVDGKPASVFGITQKDGTAGLVTSVRERFRVHLVNDIGTDTLIHWHGLTPPYQQDGVPGVSGPPIAAGGSADYDFPLPMSGTYWMHSHVGFQEQQLMTAPLIIHDAAPASEQEIVVMLHDFSFTDPATIFARLRSRPTDAKPAKAMAGMSAMAAAPDLNDVSYDAFLANDRTLADPQVVRVTPGERVRLRLINGASASNFHIELGALRATLLAVDGHPARPLTGISFPLAIAQRIDLMVELPKQAGAWPILAVVEGLDRRAGIVLATPRAGVAPLATAGRFALGPAPRRPGASRCADRRHGRLYLELERQGLRPGHPAHGEAGRAGGDRDAEPHHDVAPDASARARLPGGRDQRPSLPRCHARYRPGAAEDHRHRRLRRRQPGQMGVPLPQFVSSASGYDDDAGLR